jgi:hypothetical protein
MSREAQNNRKNTQRGCLAANDAFYMIGAAVLHCMEYNRTTEVRFFSVFRSVSRAGTVNTNAPPLWLSRDFQISSDYFLKRHNTLELCNADFFFV